MDWTDTLLAFEVEENADLTGAMREDKADCMATVELDLGMLTCDGAFWMLLKAGELAGLEVPV